MVKLLKKKELIIEIGKNIKKLTDNTKVYIKKL